MESIVVCLPGCVRQIMLTEGGFVSYVFYEPARRLGTRDSLSMNI